MTNKFPKHIGYNRLLINPFIIYTLTWITVLLTYNLHWSILCPPNLSYYEPFIVITCILSFIIGLRLFNKRVFSYRFNKSFDLNSISRYNKILYLLFAVEVVLAGGIPILQYISGNVNIKYTEFGLPFIHVIIANGFVIVCYCSCYSLLCTRNKRIRKGCLKNILISISPFILMFNRGGILYCLLGCILLYLMHCKNIKRNIILAITFSFVILWGFGILGNLRTDVKGVSNIILEFGGATEDFKSSQIPKEFFWPYIYIASPLANAELMMNNNDNDISVSDIINLAVFEMTPELISKRIAGGSINEKSMDKILDAFNVASVYGMSAKYAGWLGPITLYIFWIVFVIVTIGLIPKQSRFYTIGIVSISLITVMNTFDNMFVFMGLVPQPLIIIIACRKFKINGFKYFNMHRNLQSESH